MFPSNVWTDQTAEQIILNSVKAILLQYLQQEIPYNLRPEIELLEVSEQGKVKYFILLSGLIKLIFKEL